MHLPEILELSFLQALGVYRAYLLHSEHVLTLRWNQCSSSTNTHTTFKCLWKGAEQLERRSFPDEARSQNTAQPLLKSHLNKTVFDFYGFVWFILPPPTIVETYCWATNAHGDAEEGTELQTKGCSSQEYFVQLKMRFEWTLFALAAHLICFHCGS